MESSVNKHHGYCFLSTFDFKEDAIKKLLFATSWLPKEKRYEYIHVTHTERGRNSNSVSLLFVCSAPREPRSFFPCRIRGGLSPCFCLFCFLLIGFRCPLTTQPDTKNEQHRTYATTQTEKYLVCNNSQLSSATLLTPCRVNQSELPLYLFFLSLPVFSI